MSSPLISIIMATYNRQQYIVESLNSIKVQQYPNWECLIIDDGSTDNTKEIIKEILKEDDRFKYFKRTARYKKGLPGARNMGIDLSKGKYIVFFDDDDIVHPENLKICAAHFKEDVFYVRFLRTVFYGDFDYKFSNNRDFEIRYFDKSVLAGMVMQKTPFNSCQVVWKKECFKENRFNEDLMFAEEWECYSRILSSGIEGISIDKVLFYGRKHPESNTGEFKKNDKIRKESKVEAANLIINNLKNKKLLSPELIKYFVSLGFELKEYSILEFALKNSSHSFWKKYKYKFAFLLYPVLKPLLKFKS